MLRKPFWSFGDFVWPKEILEKYLGPSGKPGVFLILRKTFWSFGDFVWPIKILEKYLEPSRSPGVFVNC